MPTETPSVAATSALRRQLLEQHSVLRELLRRLLGAAERVSEGAATETQTLKDLVSLLRVRLRTHVACEESALPVLLGATEAPAARLIQKLLADHARQRSDLDALIGEGVDTNWDPERAAAAVRSLARDLLRDMDEEEQAGLGADPSSDDTEDVVNVDRATD
jgi:iron-sulfur cluster repair protein YtfE (RIC family)